MLTYLASTKKEILSRLDDYLQALGPDYGRINRWGADTLSRLRDYIAGGKMIRGGLVAFTHDMYKGTKRDDAIAVGAAMELFQAAFLIHDDIMDRDETRRGKPSIHTQFAEVSRKEGLADAGHIGDALGICAGDIAIFLAFEIIGALAVPAERKRRLLTLISRDLSYVGLAQMEDVFQGARSTDPSKESILTLYTYKTGRYTFSLPFAAGLLLTDAGDSVVDAFMALGEKLGILFQIKDDELGLLSDEGELGKPVGSDLSENKKTLYRESLFRRSTESEIVKLRSIYGKAVIEKADLAFVRELLYARGVFEEISGLTSGLEREINRSVSEIEGADEDWIRMLRELLAYIGERKK